MLVLPLKNNSQVWHIFCGKNFTIAVKHVIHVVQLLTSAVGQREVPGSGSRWGGQTGEGRVTFQHVAWVTAVADLVANVERGPLLVAVE